MGALGHRAAPTDTSHARTDISHVQKDSERDAWELAKTGKKAVLERRFGLVSMIGFSCTLMATWEGVLVNFTLGLENGGPAGLIWSYLLCWAGTLSVFFAMGELASMLPTAGGQYHWVSILAPVRYKRFLSYITGWTTTIAWAAAPILTSFLCGSLIQALIAMNYPDRDLIEQWQLLLIMYAALASAMLVNTVLGAVLPSIEIIILVLHIVSFFAVLIPLIYIGPKSDTYSTFTTFFNLGGWPTQALAFFVGMQGNAAAFVGTDGAIHMCEEVNRSSLTTPRSMIASVVINGAMGFAMTVVFLLYSGDLKEVIETTESQYPFITILANSLGSPVAATALVSLLIVPDIFSLLAAVSSGSRMLWSFSREKAVPGWQWLRQVDRKTSIPLHTIYVIIVVASLLSLIVLGSSVVLNDVLSLVLEAFFLSYLVALSLLLYRRMRGDIAEPSEDEDVFIANEVATGSTLVWGPWRLKGALGLANNIVALAYLTLVMFFAFWPPSAQTTPQNMNWAVLVLGGVLVGSVLYYIGWARKQYTGPIIEVEVVKDD